MKILWSVAGALFAVAAAVIGALAVRAWGLGVPVQVLTLTLGVVAAGMTGLAGGLAASVLVVLAFNYGFTPPLYTFLVDDPEDYLVFLLFLVTGAVVGTLSDRLRRLARDQVRQAREVQAAQLFQGFSHDLRTPLAVIGGTASSLRTSLADQLKPEALAQLMTIEHETGALGRQVENLLGLARLSASRVGWHLELVPAEELLFSCRDRCGSWMPGRLVTVEGLDSVPLVRVEASLVEQALLNLVDNAHRQAPEGTSIELSLALASNDVELRVADRGPGVPDRDKSRIFEKFVRGTQAPEKGGRPGTGLGLAVVAEAARLHGGSSGVRDRAGGGAEFWIRLPRVNGEGAV